MTPWTSPMVFQMKDPVLWFHSLRRTCTAPAMGRITHTPTCPLGQQTCFGWCSGKCWHDVTVQIWKLIDNSWPDMHSIIASNRCIWTPSAVMNSMIFLTFHCSTGRLGVPAPTQSTSASQLLRIATSTSRRSESNGRVPWLPICHFMLSLYTCQTPVGQKFLPGLEKRHFFSVLGRSSFGINILGVLTRALGVLIRDLGVLACTQRLVRRSCLEWALFQPKSKSAKIIA